MAAWDREAHSRIVLSLSTGLAVLGLLISRILRARPVRQPNRPR